MGVAAIFDIQPVLQVTKRVLGNQNNVFLDTIDWKPWVELELGYLLNNSTAFAYAQDDSVWLGDLGLPTEVVAMARETMRRELTKLLRMAFGPIRSNHEYECSFLPTDTLGSIYNLSIVDLGDKRVLELERQEKEELLFADCGGFVPERLRTSY